MKNRGVKGKKYRDGKRRREEQEIGVQKKKEGQSRVEERWRDRVLIYS